MLVKEHECFLLKSPQNLPVETVCFGKAYVDGYLSNEALGGGYYLERHDTPHFWSHHHKDGEGYIILGKELDSNTFHLSAFAIPYKAGIFASGGVIHSDGLLVGDVYVIYTITEKFQTGILKNESGKLVKIVVATDDR